MAEKPQHATRQNADDGDRFPDVNATLPLPSDHPDAGDQDVSMTENAAHQPADFTLTPTDDVQVPGHDDNASGEKRGDTKTSSS